MPLFSTIIPTHNRAHILARTIHSVLNQSFSDNQVIVVADNTTDDTLPLLAQFGSRITVTSTSAGDVSTARNAGIPLATGEYIAFLDDDDAWFPWTLARMKEAIDRHNRPSFLGGLSFPFADDPDLAAARDAPLQTRLYKDYLDSSRDRLWCAVGTVALRADALRKAGLFHVPMLNIEDNDLWIRLGDAPGFVFVDAPCLMGYRRGHSSLTANHHRSVQGIRYLLQQDRDNLYPGGPDRARERHRIISFLARPILVRSLHAGQFALGLSLFNELRPLLIEERNAKFLLGYPAMAAAQWAKRLATGSPKK